jgi:single-strand DNA-binding protein
MSNYTIEGRVISIGQTEQKSEKFSVRKFVIDDQAPEYANLHEFQLANAKTELADKIKTGDRVRVHFNLRGRGWTSPSGEVKYFSSLDAWKVDILSGASEQQTQPMQQLQQLQQPQQTAQAPIETDLPF